MNTTWIVAADAGLARIFEESDPAAPLRELETMTNPAAHLRESEVYTDDLSPKAGGKSINNTGAARPNSQYEPKQTFEEHNAELFAKEVLAKLAEAHRQGRFDKLDLIAEPQFLGLLRKYMEPSLKTAVCHEVNKDLIHASGQQLRAQLHPATR
jgi:protein required for attachment to host cells